MIEQLSLLETVSELRKRGRPTVYQRNHCNEIFRKNADVSGRTMANDYYAIIGNSFAKAALGKTKWTKVFLDNNGNRKAESLLIEIGRSLKTLSCRDAMPCLAFIVDVVTEDYIQKTITVHEAASELRYLRKKRIFDEAAGKKKG